MARVLKQSTSITLRLGPFLDDTDGKTAETGLTISQADIRLSKAGAAFAQSNDSGGATHDENGWYYLTLDATDTNTLGVLTVAIHESGALPVWEHFQVVCAMTYDSLYTTAGTDYLQTDMRQCGGNGVAAGSIPNAASGTNGGLPEVDSTNRIAGIQGTKNVLDDLNDISTSDVNAQVDDVMSTDTQTLPGQTAPSATPTIVQMVSFLYKSWRNKWDNDGTTMQLYDDAGSTVDQKASVSESGGTVTKGEVGTGP